MTTITNHSVAAQGAGESRGQEPNASPRLAAITESGAPVALPGVLVGANETGNGGGATLVLRGNRLVHNPFAQIEMQIIPDLYWGEPLDQARKEAAIRSNSDKTISATISTLENLLWDNNCTARTKIDPTLLSALARASAGDELTQQPGLVLTSTAKDGSALKTRVKALVRACQALMVTDFSDILWLCIRESGLTHAEVSLRSGIPVKKIKTWLERNSAFVMDMTDAQAVLLDGILGADNKLIATYAAMTQAVAYAPLHTALDQVLERTPFSQILKDYRRGAPQTVRSLLAEVEELSGIRVAGSVLARWEQGYGRPCQEMMGVIAALDQIYAAGGTLVAAWEAENPRQTFAPYLLAFDKWPEGVRRQFEKLALYKTTNPDVLTRSDTRSGDRWNSPASRMKLQRWCEHYFGYLVHVRGMALEGLSLSLLADWDLVKAYFDFVRDGTGKTAYSQDPFIVASHLHNIYLFFLPSIAAEAVREAHWAGRMPTVGQKPVKIVDGVTRQEKVELETPEEGWNYYLRLTARRARDFQCEQEFTNESLSGRALALLDAEVGVARIAAIVERLLVKMRGRIRCRKAAILLRRLAVVALLIARNFRPGTLVKLKSEHVEVMADGRIKLHFPEALFKNKGRGGSQGGVEGILPNVDWIHEAIRRWVQEGRPFLLRAAAARGEQDEGWFFIRADQKGPKAVPGGPSAAKSLAGDAALILGYNPYGQRYLFANDAWNKGIPVEHTAINLQQTSKINREVYARVTAKQRGRRASGTMTPLLTGKKLPGGGREA
jgi:hypothetical protein